MIEGFASRSAREHFPACRLCHPANRPTGGRGASAIVRRRTSPRAETTLRSRNQFLSQGAVPPALRGSANLATKRRRDPNDLLSERSLSRVSSRSATERRRPPERGQTGGFFASRFLASQKMRHEGSRPPLPLLSADFWLDPAPRCERMKV
jgi:hypothetical protein